MLNITKVAFGCASLEILQTRVDARIANEVAIVTTRYRPTRHAEIIGGSLFWIIKHHLVARQTVLGFEEIAAERRWRILLDGRLVTVHARPRRAHQGWRYLKPEDAPRDIDAGDAALTAMPAAMLGELSAIGLL